MSQSEKVFWVLAIAFCVWFILLSWPRETTKMAQIHQAISTDAAQVDSFKAAAAWSARSYESHVRTLTGEETALYVSLISVVQHPCPMPTWKIKQLVTDNILKMALVSVEELHRAQADTVSR